MRAFVGKTSGNPSPKPASASSCCARSQFASSGKIRASSAPTSMTWSPQLFDANRNHRSPAEARNPGRVLARTACDQHVNRLGVRRDLVEPVLRNMAGFGVAFAVLERNVGFRNPRLLVEMLSNR